MPDSNIDWFDRVPKVELHLHLEGAIPYDTLWELIRKYGGDPEVSSPTELKRRFVYRSFSEFIGTWIWKNGFLREYEDFEFIAEAAARDLAGRNIRYAEVFYSPSDFQRHGLETGRLTEAVRKGLARVKGTDVALVADLVRDYGPVKAAVTLAAVDEAREFGVIGVGIGGSEQLFPPGPFRDVYEKARGLGFHTTAHAGEAAGAESIREAVRELRVERIGHGTRAGEDEALLDYLAEIRIPIELCPLSNVRTGIVPSIKDHPVRRFFDRGLFITINSDDPWMFGSSLADEYRALESELGFTRAELRTLILQGIEASWLTGERKTGMKESFTASPDW